MHACMHTCMHAYIHPYIHPYMHTYTHAYMHTCIHTYTHTCTGEDCPWGSIRKMTCRELKSIMGYPSTEQGTNLSLSSQRSVNRTTDALGNGLDCRMAARVLLGVAQALGCGASRQQPSAMARGAWHTRVRRPITTAHGATLHLDFVMHTKW